MPQSLSINEFLQGNDPILDVRSPSEYFQGHIPGSFSFPLFSDHERAQIGTLYKKECRQRAIELGLLMVEPKLEIILDKAKSLLTNTGKVLCWRGGMRSGFVARLLELMGYSIQSLQGGYKAYRRWVLQLFEKISLNSPSKIYILGGMTGTGKTEILHALEQMGEQIIDLESLANHRGSAFGGIELSPQPSQENFENKLAHAINQLDWSKAIWIEDESRLIGRCHLPHFLYQSMIHAPLFYIQKPIQDRLQYLLNQYGQASKLFLQEATKKISKRLGSQLTKEIMIFLEQEKLEPAFEKLISYYDKTYQYQLNKRQTVYHLGEIDSSSSSLKIASFIFNFYKQKFL